jgi:predicted enzyme related to lactoylglutathione lyase
MTVRYFVAMIHVASVPHSIAFYEKLGFTVRNTHVPEGDTEPTWAWLHTDRAQLMVTRSDEPVDPAAQAVLFYAYCDDVEAFRSQLIAAGIDAGPVSRPFYNPEGEFRITDPDGYVVMVAHT